MRSKKGRHINFPYIKLVFFVGLIFVIVYIFFTIFRHINHKLLHQSTYTQDFSSGKEVLYYTTEGLFNYNGRTKHIIRLVNFGKDLYGSPVLSPDNTKILYYIASIDKENTPYDLWMFDLSQKKQFKLLSSVMLYPGYIQDPVWAKDSQSLFITLQDKGGNKLYRLDLQRHKTPLGTNYSGNFYWPKVINEKYLAFNVSVPNSYAPFHIGIVNLDNKQAFAIEVPDDPYIGRVQEIENKTNGALFIGFVDYTYAPLIETEEGKKDSPEIIGLELLNLDKKEAKRIKLPNSIKTVAAYRMQSIAADCGNYVLMGKVAGVPKTGASYDRGYNAFYIYNLKENTLKVLRGDDDKTIPLHCGFNKKNHKGYVIDTTDESKLVAITEKDLSNPDSEITLDYSNLLSQDLQQRIKNKCLGVGFPISISGTPADSFGGNDFVYLEVTPLPYWQMDGGNICIPNKNIDLQLAGTYRLSRFENTSTKIANAKTIGSNYQTFLLAPNIK